MIALKKGTVGLHASLKISILPDDAVVDLRNLVRDYYYLQLFLNRICHYVVSLFSYLCYS
ncbi:MAG: hypothetical protein E7244_23370 [Enterocloster citroniae]|nr:hypothetical protein [Enterocloster citroniae]